MAAEESSEMPERRASGVGAPRKKKKKKGWALSIEAKLKAEQRDLGLGGVFHQRQGSSPVFWPGAQINK